MAKALPLSLGLHIQVTQVTERIPDSVTVLFVSSL